MRRFWSIFAIFAALIFCFAFMGARIQPYHMMIINQEQGSAGITYLLKCTFDSAEDQNFTNEQVIDTAGEGCETGDITVVEAAGNTVSVVSNQLSLLTDADSDYTECGIIDTDAVTRVAGLVIMNDHTHHIDATGIAYHTALKDDTTLDIPDFGIYSQQNAGYRYRTENLMKVVFYPPSPISQGTKYKWAAVAGGYNSSGVPYKDGDNTTTFNYGAAFFRYDGSNWKLAYRLSSSAPDNDAVYYMVVRGGASMTSYIDNIKIPDPTFHTEEDLLSPLEFDTFTDSNGTSLDAHTMDVGDGWTEQSGDWDIQSNVANNGTAGIATIAAADDDVFIEAIINLQGGQGGIVLRYTDANTFWWINLDATNNLIELQENDSGFTVRDSSSETINTSTDYTLTALSDSQNIYGWVDGHDICEYNSAALNENETTHGLYMDTNGSDCDHFALWPQGSGGEYADLNSY